MSKKSDEWRTQEAKRVNEVLQEIMNCASPDTVEANKEAWENTIKGNNAAIDPTLNEPD